MCGNVGMFVKNKISDLAQIFISNYVREAESERCEVSKDYLLCFSVIQCSGIDKTCCNKWLVHRYLFYSPRLKNTVVVTL